MGSSLGGIAKLAVTAAAVVAAGAVGLGPIATALVMGGAALAGSFIASELLPSGDVVNSADSIRYNSRTTQKVIPVLYGERLIGSNDVFIEFIKDGATKKSNLWIVHAIAEGECDSIAQEGGNDLVYIDGKLVSEFEAGLIEYWFYNGTQTQTYNAELNAVFPDWTDTLRNTVYIVFKIQFDTDVFSTVPRREVVLKGLKIHDFRAPANPNAWSDNPVLALYDYLTNTRYGLGWDPSIIDIPTWIAAANYCDLIVPARGTKKWTINLGITSMMRAQSIIDSILGHFRGSLSWYDGKLFMHYADLNYETPVYEITDAQIMRSDDGKALVSVTQPSKHSSSSGVLVKYISKKNNWTSDDIHIGETVGQIKPVAFSGYTDRDLALEMGLYTLERDRLTRSYSLMLRPDMIQLDIGDVVNITSTELELSSQIARVVESDVATDGSVALSLISESIDLYDNIYDPDVSVPYELEFDFTSPPGPVENVIIVEETYTYRLRTFVRLLVSFEEPSTGEGIYQTTQIELSDDDINYVYYTTTQENFSIDPVNEGGTYYIRFRTVSIRGIKQENIDTVVEMHVVEGIRETEPADPLPLEVNVGEFAINISSGALNSDDVAGYEFRTGNENWSKSLMLSRGHYAFLHIPIFRPGSHIGWVDSISTNNLYGGTPSGLGFQVEDPLPFHDKAFESNIDFTTGTYSNTEYFSIGGGQYAIRCTRIGGSLAGTYISDPIDTGKTDLEAYWLIYFSFTYDIPGYTPGTQASAYDLKISLLHSLNVGGPYIEMPKMEFYTASVLSRYVKMKIYIVDKDDSTYLRVLPSNVVCSFRINRKDLSCGPLYIR